MTLLSRHLQSYLEGAHLCLEVTFLFFFRAGFRVSAVRSFVHLDFIVSEVRRGHPVLPAPFTEEVVFSPMHIFGNAIKSQLAALGSCVCV